MFVLKLELRRTVMHGRRAYIIEAVVVGDRRVGDQLIRTPNGEVHITEGDTWYAAEFLNIFNDILIGVRDWSGKDAIDLDMVPY